MSLTNSIVAGGTAASGADIKNTGTMTSGDYNIVGTRRRRKSARRHDDAQPDRRPLLRALSDNGGPTFTNADQATSPGKAHIPYIAGKCDGRTLRTRSARIHARRRRTVRLGCVRVWRRAVGGAASYGAAPRGSGLACSISTCDRSACMRFTSTSTLSGVRRAPQNRAGEFLDGSWTTAPVRWEHELHARTLPTRRTLACFPPGGQPLRRLWRREPHAADGAIARRRCYRRSRRGAFAVASRPANASPCGCRFASRAAAQRRADDASRHDLRDDAFDRNRGQRRRAAGVQRHAGVAQLQHRRQPERRVRSRCAKVGTDSFVVTTYASTAATGTALDRGMATIPIAKGKANAVAVHLGPAVTTTADSGVGSLRYAIAHREPGRHDHVLAPGRIDDRARIADHDLGTVSLAGPGAANAVTISGGNAHQIFFVARAKATISGLDAHARESGDPNAPGGAIGNIGNLTLANDKIGTSTSTVSVKHAPAAPHAPSSRRHPHARPRFRRRRSLQRRHARDRAAPRSTATSCRATLRTASPPKAALSLTTSSGSLSSSGDTFTNNSALAGGAVYNAGIGPSFVYQRYVYRQHRLQCRQRLPDQRLHEHGLHVLRARRGCRNIRRRRRRRDRIERVHEQRRRRPFAWKSRRGRRARAQLARANHCYRERFYRQSGGRRNVELFHGQRRSDRGEHTAGT